MTTYYKLARPDGWDFYTGKTINYRQSIGQVVRPPQANASLGLCSSGVLHASETANQGFVGARIPCSLYIVKGVPAIPFDGQKAGFLEMLVVEELDSAKHFKWRYDLATNPIHPLTLPIPSVTAAHLKLLDDWASVWNTVWDSVWDSVKDSVWHSVRASVWDSAKDSVGSSVWDSVWGSVWGSVWDSVRASVGAYVGYIFTPVVQKWKCTKHKQGIYPFQSIVDLWLQGLVPSFDGAQWRLHGGVDAAVLWQGTAKQARKAELAT